jgi:hypothetical protein
LKLYYFTTYLRNRAQTDSSNLLQAVPKNPAEGHRADCPALQEEKTGKQDSGIKISGANPTASIYNASVVNLKFHNATGNLARFES